MEAFPSVKVVFLEDLKRDPQGVVNGVFDFLELPSVPVEQVQAVNVSGTPRSKWLHRLILNKNPLRTLVSRGVGLFVSRKKLMQMQDKLRQLNQTNKKEEGAVPQQLPASIQAAFERDTAELEKILGRKVPY